MKAVVRVLAAVVVLALLALVGWRVFEHFDQQDKIKNAKKSCATFDVVGNNITLPAGFTLPAGQKLLNVQSTGKTSVIFASLSGTRDDLVDIRDRVATELEAQGYKRTGSDQEPTFEADATVSMGGVDDTINVRPLCAGKVVVRYTIH